MSSSELGYSKFMFCKNAFVTIVCIKVHENLTDHSEISINTRMK
jgi:hypothetical protein